MGFPMWDNDIDCRACGHLHKWAFPSGTVMECANFECGCTEKEHIPLDNLDYLEWKYKKSLNNGTRV